jgi:hypothetical protein
MNEQLKLRLRTSEISNYSFEELYSTLANAPGYIVLEVPCDSINSSQYPTHIALDYLWALFIGESIASFCKPISFQIDYENMPVTVCFVFQPENLIDFTQNLYLLLPTFEDTSFDELDVNIQEMYEEFVDSLEEPKLSFPDLGDLYLANFVGGIYYLYEDEEEEEREKLIEELYIENPEWRYGFWRSFASNNIDYNFYNSSSHGWIVPLSVNIETLLKDYGGFINRLPQLEEAKKISSLNLPSITFNKTNIVIYPEDKINKSRECAQHIWFTSTNSKARRISSGIREYRDFYGIGHIEKLFLSPEGDILIVHDEVAQYVFFDDSFKRIKNEVIEKYLDVTNKLSEVSRTLLGKPTDIACSWDELDDEQFEELCYDIIDYYYQPTKIRKMGKSRSRDGGRDIEFQTPERIGKEAVKWIAQCKLIRDGSSLTGTKVQVSDTVDQYGAGGFCVMTSGVIDSTLYDKLDGITRNRGVETAPWSRLEVERFLARHPELRDRYFRKGITGSRASQNQAV